MKKNWYRVPAALLTDFNITKSAILIYVLLLDKLNNGADSVKISQEHIAKEIAASLRTVQRAIKELIGASLLEVTERSGRELTYKITKIIDDKKRPYSSSVRQSDSDKLNIEKYKSLINQI